MSGDQRSGEGENQDWVYHVASQLAGAELPDFRAEERRKRRRLLVLAGIVAATILGVIATAVLLDGGDETVDPDGNAAVETTDASSSTTAAAPDTTVSAAATTDAAPTTTTPSSTVPPSTTAAPTATSTSLPAESTTTVAPAGTSAANVGDAPVRWADFVDGVVYLRGVVPDQATADEVATKAAAVVGEPNVVVEYSIDPAAPRPASAPLYVRDSILFAADSDVLDARARETLDLGVTLLTLYPQVTFDITGHTDDIGSTEGNLALSQRRVDAIVKYIADAGIDPTRLTATAAGESAPIADNATSEGRARNRRIEIQVNDLLG